MKSAILIGEIAQFYPPIKTADGRVTISQKSGFLVYYFLNMVEIKISAVLLTEISHGGEFFINIKYHKIIQQNIKSSFDFRCIGRNFSNSKFESVKFF